MAKSLKRKFDIVAEGRQPVSGEKKFVIDYRDASPALREKMEAVIAPLDAAPTDYNVVNNYGAHLVEEITALYKKVDKMSQEKLLENAGKLLPKASEALYEIDGHIGAAGEILRRYKDVYLPEAVAQVNADGSTFRDIKRYKQLLQRREEFLEHLPTLEAARALQSIVVDRLESSAGQKELLDIVRGTEFGEDRLQSRKQPAKTPKP